MHALFFPCALALAHPGLLPRQVMLHGCDIGEGSLIGIGSTILYVSHATAHPRITALAVGFSTLGCSRARTCVCVCVCVCVYLHMEPCILPIPKCVQEWGEDWKELPDRRPHVDTRRQGSTTCHRPIDISTHRYIDTDTHASLDPNLPKT